MIKKSELMSDLKFCQSLMDRLVMYADKNFYEDHSYGSNHTPIQNDIVRLRRELNNIRQKLEWNYYGGK